MTIKIDGIDKSNLINWASYQLQNVLTKEVDTLRFNLRSHIGQTYEPAIGKEVEVFEGITKIYGGFIVDIRKGVEGRIRFLAITCKDYSHKLDRQLVYRYYDSMKASDIVIDIITNFTNDGFTTTNVDEAQEISINFNYEQVSKAIQQIAERLDWDWYVDENKDIHFFSKEKSVAPFELNDTDGNFIWESIEIGQDITQVKNSIYVRGGSEALGPRTFKKVADGKQKIFQLGYEFDNLTFKKGGVSQTIGKDGIDDPASVDVIYNPNRAIVIFRDNNLPANGIETEWSGDAFMPVICQIIDAPSVSVYGEFQFRIIDKLILSNVEAKQRARAELSKWKDQATSVSFKTRKDGLKVGQKIKINSTFLGVSKWFTINRITTKIEKPTTNEKIYQVSLIGSEEKGIIQVLEDLIVKDPNKNIQVYADEILSIFQQIDEIVGITESIEAKLASEITESIAISEVIRDNPWGAGVVPTWVLGPYFLTGLSDPKRPIWLDRGAWLY